MIERRHANFIDLYETGRWRHYYTESEFLDEIRKVLRVRDQGGDRRRVAGRRRGIAG